MHKEKHEDHCPGTVPRFDMKKWIKVCKGWTVVDHHDTPPFQHNGLSTQAAMNADGRQPPAPSEVPSSSAVPLRSHCRLTCLSSHSTSLPLDSLLFFKCSSQEHSRIKFLHIDLPSQVLLPKESKLQCLLLIFVPSTLCIILYRITHHVVWKILIYSSTSCIIP